MGDARTEVVAALLSPHADGDDDHLKALVLGESLDAVPTAALAALLRERGGAVHIGSVRATKGTFVPSPPDLHYGGPVYRLSEEPT